MATVTSKGNSVTVSGELPAVGSKAPDFTLCNKALEDVSASQWQGKRRLLSIFPSVDTPVCAISTKKFNDYAAKHDDVVMLMISADLPFAQARFCGAEDLGNVHTLSSMRSPDFAEDYGVAVVDGPLRGLTARAVIVVDENDTVVHAELVPDIGQEPDYEAALKALG